MSRDVCRTLFVRSVANVLRPDRGAGKRRPAQPLEPDVVEIDDIFILARRNNFQEWLRVWKMVVSRRNNNDLLAFARENKEKFTNVVENEIKELNNVKVSFGLKAEFSIIRNNKRQTMEHYFQ